MRLSLDIFGLAKLGYDFGALADFGAPVPLLQLLKACTSEVELRQVRRSGGWGLLLCCCPCTSRGGAHARGSMPWVGGRLRGRLALLQTSFEPKADAASCATSTRAPLVPVQLQRCERLSLTARPHPSNNLLTSQASRSCMHTGTHTCTHIHTHAHSHTRQTHCGDGCG